ncbi:MAG: hemerythrin domain-containing protein [Candidatus Acidiferrales bacterium]
MEGRDFLETLAREHAGLREQLREWEAALEQANGSNYGQCQHALTVLREVCRVLADECQRHFRDEEIALYPMVEFRLPRLRGLVGQLRSQHRIFRSLFEDFQREVMRFNAEGQVGPVANLGRELIRLLRHHLELEERELHPAVLGEFGEADWHELRRLFVDSQVA